MEPSAKSSRIFCNLICFLCKFKGLEKDAAGDLNLKGTTTTPSIIQRFGFVLGLNLAEISCNVKFNKTIDGGAGIGYFINDNFQVSLMLDVTSVRQIRDHIVNSYENQPIPKTTNENYNALDSADEQLFYSKTLFGALLKFVFSL